MKPTILLTGCAGFIGSNFVKRICTSPEHRQKWNFLIFDALTYAGRKQTIQSELDLYKEISFFYGDLRDQAAVQKVFKEVNIYGIIHFAAESHVDRSISNPNIFVETNVLGTLNLLNSSISKMKNVPLFRFVHVSTDEVYGSLGEQDAAFTENTPLAPNSPYSASKASSDLLVRAYHETYGLNTSITRCSNNYGPYQFPEKLIPLMTLNALNNKPLPVYGNGLNIRDWIYVDDHNDGIWAVFEKGRSGEVYNFGGQSEKRNIEIIKTILNILNKSEDLIQFVEDRKGHDWRYAINFQKSLAELGWSPKIRFETGIIKTIQWYQENNNWLKMIQETKQ